MKEEIECHEGVAGLLIRDNKSFLGFIFIIIGLIIGLLVLLSLPPIPPSCRSYLCVGRQGQ